MGERSILDDMKDAMAALPKGEHLERVYVWSGVPLTVAWKKGGRVAVHPAALAALPKAPPPPPGLLESPGRLMGVPLYYADNDPEVRREVMEHFFGDLLSRAARQQASYERVLRDTEGRGG